MVSGFLKCDVVYTLLYVYIQWSQPEDTGLSLLAEGCSYPYMALGM